MARLGGISSEAMSTPAAGLASILRDHKAILRASNSRANVVLGKVDAVVPESVFIASSPESFLCKADIGADDVDDFKEEDVWAAERRSWHPDISRSLQIQHGYRNDFSANGPRVNELNRNGPAENVGVVLGIANFDVEGTHAKAIGSKAEKKKDGAMGEAAFGLAKQRTNGGELVRSFSRHIERALAVSDTPKHTGLTQHAVLQEGLQISQDKIPPRRSTASRMIPQCEGGLGKHVAKGHAERQSAPIQVPDWSKIMAKQKEKNASRVVMDDDEGGDEDDDDDNGMPPHELLAREYARSQMNTFSVCEGQGRTLKGRDLSRVRDAVWSQMGFAD